MQVWNVLHVARWKYRTQKWCKKSPSVHHRTTLSVYILATKARIDNRKKNLSSNISPTCTYIMVNFGLLATEIVSLVWSTPAISMGFASWQRYCTATLRCWTDGATCIWQGGHHVGRWPIFLVAFQFVFKKSFCHIVIVSCWWYQFKWFDIMCRV